MKKVIVVGAGLAGSEAAWQAAESGAQVTLYEMRPAASSPAHKTADFAELVCSNSLRGAGLENAVGVLKEEMRRLGSLVMAAADATRVPAGGALAVDREGFSRFITEKLTAHPRVEVVRMRVETIPREEDAVTIVASGPLTDGALAACLREMMGDASFYFYDAAAPIVTLESIDMTKAYRASRYGKGEPAYINCPMTEEEYRAFWQALTTAETAELHSFEKPVFFEGCMPVEVMASRGESTLLFGPLKPVGLEDPKTGVRNTYIDSPRLLAPTYQLKKEAELLFAGQMTGVEGYVESAASGLVAGINAARLAKGQRPLVFPRETCHGALAAYITEADSRHFQPMNVNFGLLPPLEGRIRDKKRKKEMLAERALCALEDFRGEIE